MTVLVHFSGPSFSKSVVLQPDAAPMDVGRDAQAPIHLPDDDRLISRRHCSVQWDADGIKVTVLSKVNGITTPHGAFSLGQSVVLAPGEAAQLGPYTFVAEQPVATAPAPLPEAEEPSFRDPRAGEGPTLRASEDDPLAALDAFASQPSPLPAAPAAAPKPDDPWGDFAKEWHPEAPKKAKPPAFPAAGPLNHAFDDAFSSSTAWRVEDMAEAAADPLASASLQKEAIASAFSVPTELAEDAADGGAALRALCQGLGIAGPEQLTTQDWERFGRSVRQLAQGFADLVNVRDDLKRQLRAADRTMLPSADENPLKSDMPFDELLHYLLFMPQGVAGCLPPQRALAETVTELRAHEFASLAAVRAAVEGAVKEFEPAKLRGTLLKGRRSIAAVVDNARLWDLYTTHYQDQGAHMADWLEQLFNRHFMPAYSREAERLRREAQPKPPERSS